MQELSNNSTTSANKMHECGILSVFLVLVIQVTANEYVTVQTPNGPVSGTHTTQEGKSVLEFLAIPFAEAPIGSLRFRSPKPLTTTWTQPLVTNKPPNGCLQTPMNFLNFPKHLLPAYSEDCLYLNIWTPTVDSESKKSVIVWIHGGGFNAGESLPYYNGKAFTAIGDVVLVSIHYRVGFMGFARFDDELVPGNNGLLDQQLALKWVHDNIAQFGGDPKSITIFGESAGSASVAYHLVNEESGQYFQRAVMQSGSFGDGGWSFNPNTEALEMLNRKLAAKYLNCDQVSAEDLLKCFEHKTEDDFKTLIASLSFRKGFGDQFGPTIDGRFLSQAPRKLLASGKVNRKDLMIGLTESEGTFLVRLIAFNILIAKNFSGSIEDLVTEEFVRATVDHMFKYYPAYPLKLSPVAKEMIILNSLSHAFPSRGDKNAIKLANTLGGPFIDCDMYWFADVYRSFHENVYFYEMAHVPSQPLLPIPPSNWTKCSHGDDLPFIFAMPLVYPEIKKMTEDELLLSRRMIGDMAYFAKTGRPLDPNWRPFTTEKKEFYRYKLKSSPEMGGLRRDQCAFWEKMLPLVSDAACEQDSESGCRLRTTSKRENANTKGKDEL